MNHATLSRIETNIDSDISVDLESVTSTAFLDENAIQSNGRVNLSADEKDSTIPGEGFRSTLGSFCFEQYDACYENFHGSFWNKIKAVFMCLTMPVCVLLSPFFHARSSRRTVTHQGIVYFYILMACTIVCNLWEQTHKKMNQYDSVSYQFLQYFEATIMVFALIAMLYIAWATKGQVMWEIHEKNLILYFRAGLYILGIASMVYTALNIYNNCTCQDGLHIIVNIAKFSFIVGQLLFLNYYYQAKLPWGWCAIQVCLAHILGTNLSLWIWTLCKEVSDTEKPTFRKDCIAISLGSTEKYFYPLFIEYLLLVAGMIYELWISLNVPLNTRRCLDGQDLIQERGESFLSAHHAAVHLLSTRRRRRFTPSLALSFVLALAFSSIFLSFILAAKDSASHDHKLYDNFIIANVCFYCTQLIACYVIKVCSQSQPADRWRKHLNLDDSLLYFGLAGIILWEGFHFIALLSENNGESLHFAHSLLGVVEYIVQTVVLVSVRRLSSRDDENARTITSMSLYLLATNLTFWVQNSFYIEQHLKNPGEDDGSMQERLDIFGNILNPIIIFFRFHSATCCYQMWVIFSRAVNIN